MGKYKNLPFIKCFLGDIRDKDRIKTITKEVDILISEIKRRLETWLNEF